jgi:hypothetical protein
MYHELTPVEQRAHDKAEAERMQALRAAIIADCKPVELKPDGSTPEGRQALENFIQAMHERAQGVPNPLLPQEQQS